MIYNASAVAWQSLYRRLTDSTVSFYTDPLDSTIVFTIKATGKKLIKAEWVDTKGEKKAEYAEPGQHIVAKIGSYYYATEAPVVTEFNNGL